MHGRHGLSMSLGIRHMCSSSDARLCAGHERTRLVCWLCAVNVRWHECAMRVGHTTTPRGHASCMCRACLMVRALC